MTSRLDIVIVLVLTLLFSVKVKAVPWVNEFGLTERSDIPTTQARLGKLWVDSLSKNLFYLDSDGNTFNVLLGGGSELNDLLDVDTHTASPTLGQFLGFDGTNWVPTSSGGKTLVAGDNVTIVQNATTATISSSGKNLVAGTGITIIQDATTATITSQGKNIVAISPILKNEDTTTATLSIGAFDYLDFNPLATVTASQGRVSWDNIDKTISVDIDAGLGVSLQVGQETYIRAVNKTGFPIADGTAVYITGAQGNRPTVAPATATSSIAYKTIGVATQLIANNAEGMITISGVVGSYNTSGFSAGDRLYLSDTTSGSLTNSAPAGKIVPVAWALNSTNSGKILVEPRTALDADTLLALDSNLYAPTQKAVKTYSDTKIAKPVSCGVNQHLAYDGSNYVCVDAAVSAGQASNYFLVDSLSGVSTYLTLSKTASTSAEELDTISLTSNGVETTYGGYADGAIGSTTIEAGYWAFNLYRAVTTGGTGGTTTITIRVFKRTTGGTETELFNINTGDINDTTPVLQKIETIQPSFAVNATDVLIVKISATTSAQPKTVTFVHNGTARNSFIVSPVTVRHNQLVGLNGGEAGYYGHVTASQTALLNSGVQTATLTGYSKAGQFPITATDSISSAIAKIENTLSGTASYATDWQTLTYTQVNALSGNQGLGTFTAGGVEFRKNGPDLEYKGKLTIGTVDGNEARIPFPSSYISADTSKIPSIQRAKGVFASSNQETAEYMVLVSPSLGYFNIGYTSGWNAYALTPKAGNYLFPSSVEITFNFSVPIQGWDSIVRSASVHGVEYDISSQITPPVGFTVNRAVAEVYKTSLGKYRAIGTVFLLGGSSNGVNSATIAGLTTLNVSYYRQPLYLGLSDNTLGIGWIDPNSGVLRFYTASTTGYLVASFNLELDSKPTWATQTD